MNAAPPLVSVVMPAFQAEAFVGDAIASALGQTLAEIEVIVVDDASTDGTWDVLAAWARRDARVMPLRQPARRGPAAARNLAIGQARGRWVALLDADDLFVPGRLAHLLAVAEAAGADLLADNMLRVEFRTGQPLGPRFDEAAMRLPGPVGLAEAVRRDMPEDWPRGQMFGFFQPLMRRDVLRARRLRYAEDVMVGEDFLLYFAAIAAGARFFLTPAAGYVQRLRAGSLSRSAEAMLHLSAANRRMLAIASRAPEPGLVSLLRRRQRQIDIACFAQLLERGELRDALRHAHCATPARLLRHARAAAGAWQRRRAATRPAWVFSPRARPPPG